MKANFYDMFQLGSSLNQISLILFIVAKLSGIAAVMLGFAGFTTSAASLLVLAGFCLFATILLCIVEMRRQSQQEEKEKKVLFSMVEDGTIVQLMKDYGYKISKVD